MYLFSKRTKFTIFVFTGSLGKLSSMFLFFEALIAFISKLQIDVSCAVIFISHYQDS